MVNEIRLQYRISLPQIEATARRFPRHPGVTALGPIMATSQPEPNRSAWEDEWPAFAAAHGLPDFVMNQDVAGHRVDVLFPDERVIIELDGWTTHQTRQAFIRDRNQDAEILARTGIPTLRITHEDFHRHPAREAARLRAILRHRQELGGAG